MADLHTHYMGIILKNPLIAGASSLTSNISGVKKTAENGAGAVVLTSLFEEQIQAETFLFEENLHQYDDRNAEMTSFFPEIEHSGPEKHLLFVKEAVKAVDIPVIASLNAVSKEVWVKYASLIEETGAAGLELNFYSIPESSGTEGNDIEKEQVEIIKEIRKSVSIPISIKLSPFYSNVLNMIKKLDKTGINSFVLFNRFFQPEIDVDLEKNILQHNLSTRNDSKIPLRFAGLLYGNIQSDICSSSGIMNGKDIAKMVLDGASCVQVVSTLFRNKVAYISKMLQELSAWMDGKGYASLPDFRGALSAQKNPDPWVYKRAQYVRHLLKPKWMEKEYTAL